jgi:hypothetical protein
VFWYALITALALTVSPNRQVLTIVYPLEHRISWVCVESEGKIDDRLNPGDFIDWFRASCWQPYWNREQYVFDRSALRYRVTYVEEGREYGEGRPFTVLKPEDMGLGTPVSPENPPEGTR